jgi:hypothetical protein
MRLLLCLFILSYQGPAPIGSFPLKGPIALHRVQPAGNTFAVTALGDVYEIHDDGRKLSSSNYCKLPSSMSPSDLVSAVINRETILVSGRLLKGGFVALYDGGSSYTRLWRSWHVLSGLDYSPELATLYVASSDTNEIYQARIGDKDEVVHFLAQIAGATHLGPVLFDAPRHRLIVGEVDSGELYTLDLASRRSHLLARNLGSPQGLLLSADANQLLIADAARRSIYRLDLSRSDTVPVIFSQLPQFSEPVGLALLSAGRVAVADDRANAIFVLTSSGMLDTQ